MKDESKIKYTFYNKYGESVDMTFTMVQIEGAVGGFMKQVQETLDENKFGKVTDVYRMLVLG